MQPYRAMKLKCFVLRLATGTAVILMAVSIAVAIISEMMTDYDVTSRWAYVAGLTVVGLMLLVGIFLFYQAFHFERFVFGEGHREFAMLKKDMESEFMVSAGNLVLTEQFVLLFAMNFFRMCRVIRTEDIVACFENPVYGTVDRPSEYTLTFYDKKFRSYKTQMHAQKAEKGHAAKEQLCAFKPWIISDGQDEFLDNMLSKAGRRRILNRVEERRYRMIVKTDVDAEAEDALDVLASEVKEKLSFRSLLNRKKQ